MARQATNARWMRVCQEHLRGPRTTCDIGSAWPGGDAPTAVCWQVAMSSVRCQTAPGFQAAILVRLESLLAGCPCDLLASRFLVKTNNKTFRPLCNCHGIPDRCDSSNGMTGGACLFRHKTNTLRERNAHPPSQIMSQPVDRGCNVQPTTWTRSDKSSRVLTQTKSQLNPS